VAICFRPIDLRLGKDANEPGQGGSGTITRRLFLGDLVHYYVKTNGIEICAYDRPRPELAEGAAVVWRVAPEHCLVLRD
jgi:iron(III) transport system ATP-binding protein